MKQGRAGGTATVLFTDLVGATELMTRVGDLAYDELRREHFERLRKAVLAHDGEDVKYTGDGLLEQGRLGELRQTWIDIAARSAHPLTRGILAVIHAELDEPAEAARIYEDFVATEFRNVPVDTFWMFTIPQLAAVASYLSDRHGAEVLHGMLAPYGERIGGVSTIWIGSLSHYLGLLDTTLGRHDEAETHFATAEATHARVGAAAWLARTRLELARMLLTRNASGDAGRARGLLDQALASATELGLGTVSRRSKALLEQVAS
ncbi:MAG: hypothetical protein ACRD0C_08435 [Acidimicrobiia bacterium]